MPTRQEFPRVKFLRRFKLGKGTAGAQEANWICGHQEPGKACRSGPNRRGRCKAAFECLPAKTIEGWQCRRPATHGGACESGPGTDGTCSKPVTRCRPVRTLRAKRGLVSRWMAALASGILLLSLAYAGSTQFLMPGAISTVHSPVGDCSGCHSTMKDGQFGWVHFVVAAANPRKDSKGCLTCHKMGPAALSPHGLKLGALEDSIRRLEAYAASNLLPISSRVRNAVFPFKRALSDGVYCATCHKEHQGKESDLKAMPDSRCQTCHTVQFDNFRSGHPKLKNYPFRRRTRIAFDHVSHFSKHFPKTISKNVVPKTSVPGECADCHTSKKDRQLMGVKPFEKTCMACHLKQIIGAERTTGPQGIALITLPGLDVETLRDKKAAIGEWPEQSEGEITPIMNLLIGWDDERKQLLRAVSKLDLLDLTQASDTDISRVEEFVWEVKNLIYALTTAKISDVLKRIASAKGSSPGPDLMAKLTANMPRDVLINAQREWLPNLHTEMEQRKDGTSGTPAALVNQGARQAADTAAKETEAVTKPTPQKPSRRTQKKTSSKTWTIDAFGRLIKGDQPSENDDDEPASQDASELPPEGTSESPQRVTPPAKLEIGAQNWAEFGGWYRRDFSILYKPTGHADALLRAWLDYSGQLSNKDERNLAFPVFEMLSSKDAQGRCTKCHSVDAGIGESRIVNWTPLTTAMRTSRFTTFAHEPHFGLFPKKGCLACHGTNRAKGFQDTYKGFDPKTFVSNFKPVEKTMCADCHGNNMARDDCLLCHKYHVNEVTSPITATRIPAQ